MTAPDLYRAAIVALRGGRWREAALQLMTLAADNPGFRDTALVLTRLESEHPEAYWHAAFEQAAASGDWDQARAAVEKLATVGAHHALLEDLWSKIPPATEGLALPPFSPAMDTAADHARDQLAITRPHKYDGLPSAIAAHHRQIDSHLQSNHELPNQSRSEPKIANLSRAAPGDIDTDFKRTNTMQADAADSITNMQRPAAQPSQPGFSIPTEPDPAQPYAYQAQLLPTVLPNTGAATARTGIPRPAHKARNMTGSSRHKATLLAILLIILGAVAALALLLFHEKSPLKHLLSDNQENAAPMHTTAADLVRAVDDQFTPGYLPEGAAQTFEAFSSDATAIAGNDIRLKMTLRRWLEASASQFQALTAVRLTCEGDADRTPLCMQAQSQLTREANQASHLREQVCAIVPCPTHPSDTIDGSPEPAG